MVIYTKKLKETISDYKTVISDYEEIYNNFYYESSSINKYWSSPVANYFFSLIDEENKESEKFHSELLSLQDIFEYLIDSYKDYEEKIIVDQSVAQENMGVNLAIIGTSLASFEAATIV